MKVQLFATALSASDRAALQSLIPLASGLGAGTIFGLFFVGRRRPSFAVFEAIAIVAVLVSVATTAYYCIALLHRDSAITNQELVETAVPLVVAAVLLILISIVARLRGATQRISVRPAPRRRAGRAPPHHPALRRRAPAPHGDPRRQPRWPLRCLGPGRLARRSTGCVAGRLVAVEQRICFLHLQVHLFAAGVEEGAE